MCQAHTGTTTNGRVSGLLYTSQPPTPVNCLEDDSNSTFASIAYSSCPSQYTQGDLTTGGNLSASGVNGPAGSGLAVGPSATVFSGVDHGTASLFQQTLTAGSPISTSTCCSTLGQVALPSLSTAYNYSFHCDLPYQAVGAPALVVGVKSTTAPTFLFGQASIYAAANAAPKNDSHSGTGNSSVTVATGPSSSASGIPLNAYLDGTIELPANTGTNLQFGFAVSGGTSPSVTLQRGAYCRVW